MTVTITKSLQNLQKPKEKMCYQCGKTPPLSDSLYCSDECIILHAEKAKAAFGRGEKTKTVRKKNISESSVPDKKCFQNTAHVFA